MVTKKEIELFRLIIEKIESGTIDEWLGKQAAYYYNGRPQNATIIDIPSGTVIVNNRLINRVIESPDYYTEVLNNSK